MDNLTDDDREALERLALDAIKAIHRNGGRELSQAEAVAFIARPVYIVGGRRPIRPKAKKTRIQFSSELRRGVFHKLVRLPTVRAEAKRTRRGAGDYSRRIVFGLIREAITNGTPRRGVRAEVKRLAASRKIAIVGEWQLGHIIKGFFKVDTTT